MQTVHWKQVSLMNCEFKSQFNICFQKFINEKKAAGYKYDTECGILIRFDDYLFINNITAISQDSIKNFIFADSNRKEKTLHNIAIVINQFVLFLNKHGQDAKIYPLSMLPKEKSQYIPYIFTKKEIMKIIEQASHLNPGIKDPYKNISFRLLFELLYCCGLRISEALSLKVLHIDKNKMIINIRHTKQYRDRDIPITTNLIKKIDHYIKETHKTDDMYLFSNNDQHTHYSYQKVHTVFKEILFKCNIPYNGRDKGPNLHSLRHTFAVHSLRKQINEGKELMSILPVLSKYMGHRSVSGTQNYLHLTKEFFSDCITEQMRQIIPDIEDDGDIYEK